MTIPKKETSSKPRTDSQVELSLSPPDATLDKAEAVKKDGESESKKKNQTERLVELALANAEMMLDQAKRPFACVKVDDHQEIHRCDKKIFGDWLCNLFYEFEGKIPGREAISSAMHELTAMASIKGRQKELHNRVGRLNDYIYYDLSTPDWQAVRVGAGKWEVVNAPPMFIRHPHQQTQVVPIAGGNLEKLFDFLHIVDKDERLLLSVYLVSCFIPDIPHPIPVIHGPMGSGKSSVHKMLRRLIDPSELELLALPNDVGNLVMILDHHWAPIFDNIDNIKPWQSDALCRAVTGEGVSKRSLYTNDDAFIYSYRRCVGLNGINPCATRPDLLDRSILIELDRIPDDKQWTEADLWERFEEARPGILGSIFDVLSRAVPEYPNLVLQGLPRMADFAKWGCAIAIAMGYTQDDFLRAYDNSIKRQHQEAIEGHPVALAMVAFMSDKSTWVGTPSNLLKQLKLVANKEDIDTRQELLPKAPHMLTRRLNEVRANLMELGIRIEKSRGSCRQINVHKNQSGDGKNRSSDGPN